ncbi:MAG: N-(5'-phosphoribosyl)anthranilate isomerase [Saprospiraceae bacterium]|nr:N-(5'-phosphoribosyl)anthranilate isomerase [Saprospiraceae bacterium]
MQLKTAIKASAINNLTDARYFSAWGVEWLGFNMNFGDSNYLEPQAIKEIKEWLVGPKIVGEFLGNQSAEQISQMVVDLKLDMIQLGMFASVELVKELGDIPIIKEWIIGDWSDLQNLPEQFNLYASSVELFMLNFSKNNLTWKMLKQNPSVLKQLQLLTKNFPVLLNIDFQATDYEQLAELLTLKGLSLQGDEEEKVGYKSFDELDLIFEELEVEI